jgi:hypothetical protein
MMQNRVHKINSLFSRPVIFLFILTCYSCKQDDRLDKIVLHDNPFVQVRSPEILLDHLNNPAAPFFVGNRLVFAESGKGTIYEYKQGKAIPLISGFGFDNYAGYSISVLGLTSIPEKRRWIIAASQDSGHIMAFDESTFPTTAAKGREIDMHRTDATNPFAVLLAGKGRIIVASGGTKSVYQGFPEDILKPVFDVKTGVAGMTEDTRTGDIFGAVIGSGKNDGALVRWNPNADSIQLQTVAGGFSNLVGVLMMPDGLLLVLEFGVFATPASGRISVIDPNKPDRRYPLISGLDFPSGFSLSPDNTLLISTFGKKQADVDGMLITLQLDSEK